MNAIFGPNRAVDSAHSKTANYMNVLIFAICHSQGYYEFTLGDVPTMTRGWI